MIHARSQPASLVEHLKYMSYSPVFHMLWIWLYNFCSTVCACLYIQRDEFLRCDKAQWVKLDGSCWDGASRMMRSCWPPQPRLFLHSLSLLSRYIFTLLLRHQRLKHGVRQKTKSHVFPWELKAEPMIWWILIHLLMVSHLNKWLILSCCCKVFR